MTSCNANALRLVLDDQQQEAGYDETVSHLSECTRCQLSLEQMAAGEWWWNEGRDLMQSSAEIDVGVTSSSVLAVTAQGQHAGPNESADELPDGLWSTDFLDPPKHPELLGQLGKYQIESVIGRGGMGIVLKGFDTELNRTVAIKVLAPHLASHGTARQRFAREARAAAAVVHDHVVAIHGIEATGDLPYIVMPFVGGMSLQKYVEQQGPLETIDVVRIGMQIASGLAAAHEQGLVHRDVKPANILLENGFGRVLITDFGLARAADDTSITRSGLVAGTPHYMSPEQANGDAVDHRSDLFSLGTVLYFIATGRTPFRGSGPMAVLNAICHKEPRPIQELNEYVPRPLSMVIGRLLSKSADDRYASSDELRSVLAEYLAHLQSPARNPLPLSLQSPWITKQGWWLVLCVCLLALTILGVAASDFLVGNGSKVASPVVEESGNADDSAVESDTKIEASNMLAEQENSIARALAELNAEVTALEQPWQQTPIDTFGQSWERQISELFNQVDVLNSQGVEVQSENPNEEQSDD